MHVSHLLSSTPTLSDQDDAALRDLYVRGTPANTLRAYERDLLYIRTWRHLVFGSDLAWPEREEVALRFILDHARDLTSASAQDSARLAADFLIDAGLRKSLACPAPATLDRRIASWCTFHRMRNLASPFEAPAIRQTRSKARRAAARPRTPKSSKPIVRDVLNQMLATCEPGLRGVRDRALLLLGWASGGRRRSEIANLKRADVDLDAFETRGLVWVSLIETKTTRQGATPKLVLKGSPAEALVTWIRAADLVDGPLFRPISKSARLLSRPLSPDGIYQIVKRRLQQAGLPVTFASPHGLRSGFLTQAALDGVPIQAAMQLSLHRSTAQAQRYYADVEIADNPATNLWNED